MTQPAKYEYRGKLYTPRELMQFARVRKFGTLDSRLRNGWSVEAAVETPKCPASTGGRKVSKRPECRVFVEPRRA